MQIKNIKDFHFLCEKDKLMVVLYFDPAKKQGVRLENYEQLLLLFPDVIFAKAEYQILKSKQAKQLQNSKHHALVIYLNKEKKESLEKFYLEKLIFKLNVLQQISSKEVHIKSDSREPMEPKQTKSLEKNNNGLERQLKVIRLASSIQYFQAHKKKVYFLLGFRNKKLVK